MWKDEIVEQVRQAREAHAARFNFDLDAIYADLKRQEQNSGRRVIRRVTSPYPTDPRAKNVAAA